MRRNFLRFVLLILSLFFILSGRSRAIIITDQELAQKNKLEEQVVVTASLAPVLKSEAGRNVLVMTAEEIKNLPVSTVEELLKYVAGIDFQQRGAAGVQVDPSVRGGTFEQVLILINGFKLNDSQAGHNSLNIPVSLEDVERIEILKGPGSRVFGPNALSGAINIITRTSKDNSLSFSLKRGQYGYQDLAAGFSLAHGRFNNVFSFISRACDGYMENTDFNHLSFHNYLAINLPSGRANFQEGFSEKAFGANGFYSSSYPEQWEKNSVLFLAADSVFYRSNFIINAGIYLRSGTDEFLLKRNDPSFYRNLHHNLSGGAEIKFHYFSGWGETSAGFELRTENIDSNRLGRHGRRTSGLFLEHKIRFSAIVFLVGGVLYHYPGYGWKFWPGAEASYGFGPNLQAYISYNQAFRLPTFTELYYSDPVNSGNPDLRPEKTRETEAGLRYSGEILSFENSVFYRKADNLIDWVKLSSAEPWRAENISKIITLGTESSLSVGRRLLHRSIIIDDLKISFVYYHTGKDLCGYLSKYALTGLKKQFLFNLQSKSFSGLRFGLHGRYYQRLTRSSVFVLDGRLSWTLRNLELFVEATNLGNRFYYDAGFLPAPGRWVYAGLKIKGIR